VKKGGWFSIALMPPSKSISGSQVVMISLQLYRAG